jgi:hypothetical protein
MADKKRPKAFTFKDVKDTDDLKKRMIEGILDSDYIKFVRKQRYKHYASL